MGDEKASECGEIPVGVTLNTRELDIAGATMADFSLGELTVKDTPQFQKIISEADSNSAVTDVFVCKTIARAGVRGNAELVDYFTRMTHFFAGHPSVSEQLHWRQTNPFPKAASFTGSEQRADLHITKYQPISLKPGQKARLNVHYENRGKLDALDVFIIARMRFADFGKSVSSARDAEEALLTEIQTDMKLAKDKITGSVPAGDQNNFFSVEGPVLEQSDLSMSNDSDGTEILRGGRVLLMVAVIQYRDRNGVLGNTESCRLWTKPNMLMSCMSGHNGGT